jgi:hypothetical protein
VVSENTLIPKPRRRPFKWALLALALLPVALVFGWFIVEMGTQAILLPSVERRIGAEIRAPVVRVGGETRELMTFERVRPGACANAGIASGDIIISHRSIGQLCRQLRGAAGKQVVVDVVPGGDGAAMEARPARRVVITLP